MKTNTKKFIENTKLKELLNRVKIPSGYLSGSRETLSKETKELEQYGLQDPGITQKD